MVVLSGVSNRMNVSPGVEVLGVGRDENMMTLTKRNCSPLATSTALSESSYRPSDNSV